MTILKIKRALTGGNATPASGALLQGELGFSYQSNNLFIGGEDDLAPILLTTVKTVNSVSPVSGNITLTTSNITEGSNLYYTDARVASYVNGTLVGSTVQGFDSDLSALAALSSTGMLVRTGSGTATTRTITGTAGDISVSNGDGVAGNPTLDLVNTGTPVSASFVKITTDAKGRVSATTAVTTSDITSLVDATYVNVSGDTMTGFLTLSADPTSALHAATKAYVDAVAAGLSWKTSVKAASTGNLTLSGAQTIDGIALVAGQRVLVKNQTAPEENGIYVVNSGAWVRATDMDSTTPINEINGAAVFVELGTVNGGKGYTQIDQVSALNTDPIAWAIFSSTTAGVGSVSGTANRITSTGGTSPVIDIAATYVGQTSITTLGDITTGTWDGGYVHSTGTVTGTNLSGTNTGDQTITLTGDVTGSGTGSFATTLATVNSNVGSFGGASSVPSFTVNAKGLITAASATAVVAPAGTLTGTTLAANVVTSSLTSVGTITSGVWNGTAIDATHGGTAQTSWTTGDLLYASASNTLSKRAIGTTGQVLTVSGGVPTWASPATSGTVTSIDVSGGTTGLTTSGGPVTTSGTITLSGTLAIANGGTGQTTANAAFNALAPSQTGNAGYFLTTDATNTSWTNTIDGGSF